MKIAILGWGSLLWDQCTEFDAQHDSWNIEGPELKIEFSRISKKTRKGALTLVIDDDKGAPTKVAWCRSKRSEIDDAACDLRCREGTTCENIRRVVVSSPGSNEDPATSAIRRWACLKAIDAVVWTGLKSNFEHLCRKKFSVETALEYLKTLSPEGKAMAFEYIVRAPDFVKTQLRRAVEGEPWFKEIAPPE